MSILVKNPSLVPLFIVLTTLLTKLELINTQLGKQPNNIIKFTFGLSMVINFIISNIDMFTTNPHLLDTLTIVDTISVGTMLGTFSHTLSPVNTIINLLITNLAFMSLWLVTSIPVNTQVLSIVTVSTLILDSYIDSKIFLPINLVVYAGYVINFFQKVQAQQLLTHKLLFDFMTIYGTFSVSFQLAIPTIVNYIIGNN